MTPTLRRVPSTQAAEAARLYARAFLDDPLFTYFVPDPRNRREKLTHLFEFVTRGGLTFGEVLTMGDRPTSTASLLPPDNIKWTLWQQISCGGIKLCLTLGLGVVHRMSSFHDFSTALQRRCLPERHYYLELLAVDPDAQGTGQGGSMLRAIQARLSAERMPLYLETENEKNVPFYAKRGFTILEATHVPKTSIPVWAMAWHP